MPVTPAIRNNLPRNSSQVEHPGLFFSRFPTQLGDDSAAVRTVQRQAANTPVPDAYRKVYRRWQQAMPPSEHLAEVEVEAIGPIAIGLGNMNPSENGLSLHHTYGVPFLSGSALKGLTRHMLTGSKALGSLLGDSDNEPGGASEGAVTFHDAWLVPEGKGMQPLHQDTITVHHPQYYQKRGEVPPTDFDDPNPIPLLVIRPGVRFLVRLAINSAVAPEDHPEYAAQGLDLVKAALLWGLENEGIGGKTNAGYGRMRLRGGGGNSTPQAPPRDTEARAVLSQIEPLAAIAQASPGNVAALVAAYEMVQARPEPEQRLIAQAIFKKVNGGGYIRHRDQPWYTFAQELGRPSGRR
jgi:CRISPR-associated protein Cmr6